MLYVKVGIITSRIFFVTTGQGLVGMVVYSVGVTMFSLELYRVFVEVYTSKNKVNEPGGSRYRVGFC